MQSKAKTVAQYLAELPEDRRAAISAVRKVILKNLHKGFEEGMLYGMIGYYVPHRIYPDGYHCDPKLPLCYLGLASQKNYMSLYLMTTYDSELLKWFETAWAKAGKKLDMGVCCLRFKKLDDLALDVIAELLRRVPLEKYIAQYEAAIAAYNRTKKRPAKPRATAKATKRAPAKKAVRKVARKR